MSRGLPIPDRLLLRAYPKGPRREELADTLLMAAADGHRRPGPGAAVNLARHGLRARLGRPGSRGIVVLAVLIAVLTGFVTASLANRVAWEAAPALPAGAQRDALNDLITPGLAAHWYATGTFRDNGGETDAASIGYDTGRTPATEDVDAYLAGLRARLAAAGWDVGDSHSTAPTAADGTRQNNSQALTARTDDLVLSFEDYFDATYAEGGLTVAVYRVEPSWLTGATAVGGVLGMLIGWLLTGWAARRLEHHPVPTALAAAAAALGVVLLTPGWLLGVLMFVDSLTGDSLPDSPFWRGLTPTDEFGGLSVPAAAMAAVALSIAALTRPARPLGMPRRPTHPA